MYDLDGSDVDWIEIYNPDQADLDLTSLKLLINNSTSNHSINNSSGSAILHKGDYGVIVASSSLSNYQNKWGTTGNVFTSSFSLNNDSGKIEINNGDKTNPLSSVSYDSTQGAGGDGNSLQLISGSWTATAPTPNVNNTNSSLNSNQNNNDNNTNNTSLNSNNNSNTKTPVILPIKTKIKTNSIAFVGMANIFEMNASGHSGEDLHYGKYFWNFGDGDSKEVNLIDANKFTHTYFYPGEYNVTLGYYQNFYSDIPDALDKFTIKVIPVGIIISSVGNDKDFFIELKNNSDYDTDISKWVLFGDNKNFILPKGTILNAGDTMILSPKLTHFNLNDKNFLILKNSDYQDVFYYSKNTKIKSENKISGLVSKKQIAKNNISYEDMNNNKISLSVPILSLNNSAKNTSDVSDNDKDLFFYLGFVTFLGLMSGIVYFVRKNRFFSKKEEDFKILDE